MISARGEYPRVIGQARISRYGVCDVLVGRYIDNDRVAIELVGARKSKYPGERIAAVSANVPESDLIEGEFCVRDYDLGSITGDLYRSGLFEIVDRKYVRSGHVTMPVWRIR